MKTVLVTGSSGFIGSNLCNRLEKEANIRIFRLTRETSEQKSRQYTESADIIYHLASVMRPKNVEEYNTVNVGLTGSILNMVPSDRKVKFVLASSVQADLDNPYGISKKAAEESVFKWAEKSNNRALIYRLPNVFGPGAKPNYSSVVATFCHNIAHNIPVDIHDPGKVMNFAYIDDVLDDFLGLIKDDKSPSLDGFYYISQIVSVTLQELADIIQQFRNYNKDSRPKFNSDLEKHLYTTYMSYVT